MIFHLLLTFSLVYFFSGIAVLFKNKNSLINHMFFSMCLNVGLSALSDSMIMLPGQFEMINLWRRASIIGWSLFFGTWLDFALLTRKEDKKWMTDIRRLIMYIPSFLFIIVDFNFRPLTVLNKINGMWQQIYPTNFMELSLWIYFIVYMLAGIYVIYKWGRDSSLNREKKQAKVIGWTSFVSFLLFTVSIFISPITGIQPSTSAVIFPAIALAGHWYATVKYRMMSISPVALNNYILKTIKDPVIIVGKDLRVSDANPAAYEVTGYEANEMAGISFNSLLDDSEQSNLAVKMLSETRPVENMELGLLTRTKLSIPCVLSGSHITDDYGDNLGTAFVFHNITDRKNYESILQQSHQELEDKVRERTTELDDINRILTEEIKRHRRTEMALKSSEEMLNSFIRQSSDGILILDMDQLGIMEVNKEASKLLGYTQDMLQGKPIYELLPFLDGKGGSKFFDTKETVSFKRIDGAVMQLEFSSTLIYFNDKRLLLMKLRDRTEELAMEEHKQHIAKMESLGTLASGIAHDFNNILAGIMGYTELIMDEDCGEDIRNNLQEIFKLGQRAKRIISQILTFSSRTIIEPDFTNVCTIVEDVVKMLRATIPASIGIECNVGSQPSYVYADPGEIHQLIMNLCVNAQLAMLSKGGTLSIDLENTTYEKIRKFGYHNRKKGNYIKITIADTGCGIDQAIIDRIFEPFFTTREKEGGTGLGLSVVHGIVNRYGGSIAAESEAGKGSTFTVFLPSAGSIGKKEGAKTEISGKNSGTSILFVDDEESITSSAQRLLKNAGYELTACTSAKSAIEVFNNSSDAFDIVITDQYMPEMTGDVLLEKLRTVRQEIPAILCTGYGQKEVFDDMKKAGFQIVLFKPVSKLDYIKAINELLNI